MAKRRTRRRRFPLHLPDRRPAPLNLDRIDASSAISVSTPPPRSASDVGRGLLVSPDRACRARCGARRPPRCIRVHAAAGHHAGRNYLGGYSYLNHAAICAEAAPPPEATVAILDVDYHHGNGTQDIFAGRDDVVSPRSTPTRSWITRSSGAMPMKARRTSSTCHCRARPNGAATAGADAGTRLD